MPKRPLAAARRRDWYFLPLKLRSTGDGPKLLQALAYVRKHWPWFDRLQGHRHFVLHTGDSGRGEVQAAVRAATANMTLAAAMGCLPVVVSDGVLQPFEPEMDWAAFALRVAHPDVPGMHQVLGAVDAAAYAGLQAAVRCAAEHLLYSSISGAVAGESGRWDAFETILEVLRMQQTYPGLDPARYADTDERFRTFINCGARSMREYGEAVRQAAAVEYGGAAALVEKVRDAAPQGGGAGEGGWDAVDKALDEA
eukprot:XP_001689863.1 exostosin-like glycosyltransferase [Chlamydomonas reinhardtii]